MTEQSRHWWTRRLQSPCCAAPLDQHTADALACSTCGREYAIEPFGPDLMPPWLETADTAVADWREVQAALGRWRQRTWNGGARAAARADDTRRLVDAFLSAARPRGEVLDVGCGNGWIRELLEPLGCTYAGVDPMPTGPGYGFPFARAVADCLPLVNDSVDTCLFLASIDYSISIEGALAQARRVLRPGGLVAVATPIQQTKEPAGERLHTHHFLSGELENHVARAFDIEPADVNVLPYRDDYHFLWAEVAA
jgi:SAM-dependent methyltransferase